jgi:N-sulphoglucosamine sulphohydrolase, C-terminal
MSRFSSHDESNIDELYRERLESMLAVDDVVGSLIQELKADGQLENTFIFFASDNGYLLGQHRIQDDKRYPYEESVRTPLFVRGPGVSAGSSVEKLVVNTDFAPTFAELAGTSSPPADGRSFVPLLQGQDPSSWRSAILLEAFGQNNKKRTLPAYEAIRTEAQKYVEYATGDRELYDLKADPYEQDNDYEAADSSAIADLKRRLDALRACLVNDRVRVEEANSASFLGRTASYGPFCGATSSILVSISTEEKLLREVLCVPQNVSSFNPHLYQTGSKKLHGRGMPRSGGRPLEGHLILPITEK